MKVIATSVSDITPINGYLEYPETLASRVVTLTTNDNEMTEDEKVYSVILVSSRGGAEIDNPSNSKANLKGKVRCINLTINDKDFSIRTPFLIHSLFLNQFCIFLYFSVEK